MRKLIGGLKKGSLELLAGGIVLAGSVLANVPKALGDIIVGTRLENKYVVADDEITYHLDVVADANGEQSPDTSQAEMVTTQWTVAIPDVVGGEDIAFSSCSLPESSEDFYGGAPMDPIWNFVSCVIDPNKLGPSGWAHLTKPSARIVQGAGVEGSGGILGSYEFNIPSSVPVGTEGRFLPWGNISFPLTFSDSEGEIYNYGFGIRPDLLSDEVNEQFTVVQRGDCNHDGVVNTSDAPYFVEELFNSGSDPEVSRHVYDMNRDGAVDGGDIQPFVNALLE